jgi:hypothetical protein
MLHKQELPFATERWFRKIAGGAQETNAVLVAQEQTCNAPVVSLPLALGAEKR